MNLVVAVVATFLLLAISEVLWRRKILRGESARKFVHITVGTFVAFWPYFLTWQQIELLAIGGFILVLLAMKTTMFHVGRDIKRLSFGDLFFPIGIGVAAALAPDPIIFTAAILHLSLADGLAAVVGVEYGMRHKYKVNDGLKTMAGTLTFLLVSIIIVAGVVALGTDGINTAFLPLIILLPLATTLAENLSPYGLDNLIVPLLVIGVLSAAAVGA